MSETLLNPAELRAQATELRLHGLLAHWSEVMAEADGAQRIAVARGRDQLQSRRWPGWNGERHF